MKKKILLFSLLIALCFSSCAVVDEMKSWSIYSDFIFAFQKEWKENNLAENFPPVTATVANKAVYNIPISDLNGSCAAYSGNVQIVFEDVIDAKGKTQRCFKLETTLEVASDAKTVLSRTSHMTIEAYVEAKSGLIIDGFVLLRNTTEEVNYYVQTGNLEGLYIFIKEPENTPSGDIGGGEDNPDNPGESDEPDGPAASEDSEQGDQSADEEGSQTGEENQGESQEGADDGNEGDDSEGETSGEENTDNEQSSSSEESNSEETEE